jgi:imidazolonepropionase-like amidohydrolase
MVGLSRGGQKLTAKYAKGSLGDRSISPGLAYNYMKTISVLFVLLLAVVMGAAQAAPSSELVLSGGTVYPAPGAKAIRDAVVVIRDGKIISIEKRHKGQIPRSATVLDCSGKFIVAGFWNSHVHFTEGIWADPQGTAVKAGFSCTTCLQVAHMHDMLTRWGFTTVWDLGSDPQKTLGLRRMIDAGVIPGPKILMAGDIFPKHGHPVYVPAEIQLPEAATPADAQRMVRGYMYLGLDGTKLFTGSYMGQDKPVINMDAEIVKAAVEITHELRRPVFAHPQNHTGVDVALAGSVDVLAHTIPTEGSFTADELAKIKQQHTAMTPTLTLWTTVTPNEEGQKHLVQAGVDELKAFMGAGGTVLFGTDVGFINKYDTGEEFEYMGRAMTWSEILASLTTNPAGYFKAPTKGRVEKDMDGDLVVLSADPAVDVKNFGKVAWTVRAGKVIYEEAGKK